MHTLPTNSLLNWRVHELHQILNLRQNRACCLWHTLSLREGFLLDNCERWRSRRCFSMGRKSPPLCSSALQTPEIETIIFQWHNLVATFRIITFLWSRLLLYNSVLLLRYYQNEEKKLISVLIWLIYLIASSYQYLWKKSEGDGLLKRWAYAAVQFWHLDFLGFSSSRLKVHN